MSALTFDMLTKEQQEKVLDINLFASKLHEFSQKATNKLFIFLFDKKEGNWQYHENFCGKNNKNILTYFNTLTEIQKGIIISNIFFNEKLYENC